MNLGDLDVEELKHLALRAMRTARDEDALRLLKAALALEPRNIELLYLLATVHSNIGMEDRAIAELTQILAVEPDLVNGRFQLGLLHFTKRQFQQAASVWVPLIETLDPEHPFRLFAEGLTHVGHDRLAEGVPYLERGIELSSSDPLKEDMARVVAECRRYLEASGGVNPSPSASDARRATTGSQHVLLSGYGKTLNS